MSEQNSNVAATPPPPPPQYVSVKVMYQAVIFVSLAMSVLTIVIYHQYVAPKFASFDLQGYLVQIRDARAANVITKEQGDKMLEAVRVQIDALPSNYIVISGDAILGNATRVKKLMADPR